MFSSHIGMTADAAVKLNKFSYKARLPITQDVCWFNLNTELGFKSITPLKYCVPPKLLEISKKKPKQIFCEVFLHASKCYRK